MNLCAPFLAASEPWAACGMGCLAGLGSVLLFAARPRLRGTTLTDAWAWALLAWLLVSGVEVVVALADAPGAAWVEPLRLVAGAATLCPWMAVLGAKRPHEGAWRFVVATLWAVLALPAAAALVSPTKALPAASAAMWVLPVGILLGGANYLHTRHAAAAVLAAAGQTLLLGRHFPWPLEPPGQWGPRLGVTFLTAAIAAACLRPPRRRPGPSWDRLWLDYRDAYGVLWALRVRERINAAAATGRWSVRLGWSGFCSAANGDPAAPVPAEAEPLGQVLVNLLRRFVTPAWMQERAGEETPLPEGRGE